MPDPIEIQVEIVPSIECLRKLVALIEELIERLEAARDRRTIPVSDQVLSDLAVQTKLLGLVGDDCTVWVCADCHPGQFKLPASRQDLLEKLTHFLKVLDKHLPPSE